MKIGVDAGCLGVKDERLKVGVYTVVKNLLIKLGKIDKENEYFLYSFYPIEKSLLRQFGPRMKNIVVTPTKGWLTFALPLRLLFDQPRVFIAANQALPFRLPFSYYKIIGIVYDIAFEKYPELYSYAASASKHQNQSRTLAKNADTLIAISENTKKDVIKLYQTEESKIRVSYPAVEKSNNVAKYKNKNPYFLFVGSFKKSKNIPFLIQSFDLFLRQSKKEYDLFLVGGDKWMDSDIQNTLDSVLLATRKHIHMLGFLSKDTVTSLYKGAVAFVSPSLYEGFGLPMLEAQSVGSPVIASKAGSLPEIFGESAMLVDPTNRNMLSQAMRSIGENKDMREKYSKKGKENSKKYAWKKFAMTFYDAIRSYE